MFSSYKLTRIISGSFLIRTHKPTSPCYFSAEATQFIKKAKYLEKLKTDIAFPQKIYEYGKYILLFRNEMICLNADDRLVFHSYEDVMKWNKSVKGKTVLLDVFPDSGSYICLFAINFEGKNIKNIENETNGKFVEARGLLNFCESYRFCNCCSGNLSVNAAGNRKQCINCQAIHYPTLSPVGLTLIEDMNHEEVLLVRQERHPQGLYTCVAGFIEPGESLEDNVRREVAEEVGLEVAKVEYCTSQHWALPASQMALGCIATAIDKNVEIDSNEIQSAKWVTAEELKGALIRTRKLKDLKEMTNDKLWAPPQNAVSHYLMIAWLKRYHDFDLTVS